MKKYFLFTVVLLGLAFACSEPTSNNKSNAGDDTSTAQENSTGTEEQTEQQVAAIKKAVTEDTEKFITEISAVIELTDEDKNKLKVLSNAHAQSITTATREKDKIRLERQMWDESFNVLDDKQVRELKGFLEEKWDKEDAEFQRKRKEKLAEERRIKIEANKKQ